MNQTNEIEPRFNYTGNASEGHLYRKNADLDISEIAQNVRKAVKGKYPKCKFSVTIERYSGGQSMTIALTAAPFEAFDTSHTHDKNGHAYNSSWGRTSAQLNQYALMEEYRDGYNNGSYLTKEAHEALAFAYRSAAAYNFDDSDGMIDYFHVNFYVHMEIGRWNKPFKRV